MKVSDYIALRLSKETNHVFMVTGGGAMFLNNSFSNQKNLIPIYCHHEQSCSFAAEAYSRFGKIGLINVTTGPGGLNALNGVYGAWTDSYPMIIISGQVKRQTTPRYTGQYEKIRQLGDQEFDIIDLSKKITKKSVFISEPEEVPFVLEELIEISKDGRPGPVWMDIPIDIQNAEINTNDYFKSITRITQTKKSEIVKSANKVSYLIKKSKRPVILVGSAIYKNKKSVQLIKKISKKFQVPISPAWTAVDIMSSNDRFCAERSGPVGSRAGNFIVDKADLLLVLGSRVPIRQASYNFNQFAKNAKKIVVDIDKFELTKPLVKFDVKIEADISDFINALSKTSTKTNNIQSKKKWLNTIKIIKKKLPLIDKEILEKPKNKSFINPYIFSKKLFQMLKKNEVVVCSNASVSVIPMQSVDFKKPLRIISNAGSASMGYELPAAIGAKFANKSNRVICLAGDGSIMQNIQELDLLKRYNLNIKIIIFNNEGYLSIKITQRNFFKKLDGSNKKSGISFPSFKKVADTFNLKYLKIQNEKQVYKLKKFLNSNGPGIIEVMIDPEQIYQPKLGSFKNDKGKIVSDSLDNMSPHLDQKLINELRNL